MSEVLEATDRCLTETFFTGSVSLWLWDTRKTTQDPYRASSLRAKKWHSVEKLERALNA